MQRYISDNGVAQLNENICFLFVCFVIVVVEEQHGVNNAIGLVGLNNFSNWQLACRCGFILVRTISLMFADKLAQGYLMEYHMLLSGMPTMHARQKFSMLNCYHGYEAQIIPKP